jgi:predicted hotdog family 3-hydroxylacyl-ACP dehydratase
MDALALPAEQLTAHQPPALLVERALAAGAVDGRVRCKPHAGLDALQLVEAMAQALAVLMGVRLRGDGGAAASGMLVGAKDVVVARAARAGETVEISARLEHELGPLQLYAVRALVDDVEIARGELKTARTGGPP